jgi:hypothetical protein
MIVLRGPGNAGKTGTIRLVFGRLREEGEVIRRRSPRCRRRSTKEVRGAILKIDGVLVGILSVGDWGPAIEPLLQELIDAGCVIIICATHTRGDTVTTVERLASQAEPPYKVRRIRKERTPTDHDEGNERKADEIMAAFRQAIAEAQPAELVEA